MVLNENLLRNKIAIPILSFFYVEIQDKIEQFHRNFKRQKKHEHLRSGRYHKRYNKRKEVNKAENITHLLWIEFISEWRASNRLLHTQLTTSKQVFKHVIFKLENLTQDACPLTAMPGNKKNGLLCRGCIMLSNNKISLQRRY